LNEALMAEAKKNAWTVISMKAVSKTTFLLETKEPNSTGANRDNRDGNGNLRYLPWPAEADGRRRLFKSGKPQPQKPICP